MNRPIQYIDLFAGCGGISLGLYNAGLRGVFAVEKHPDAFQTLEYNLIANHRHFDWPDWLPIENWDVTKLLETKSKDLSLLRGQIDLIVGGPPCQGFSVAGQRRAFDKRNQLIYSYLDFVEVIQPRVIMFENVRGFTLRFSNSTTKEHVGYSEIVLRSLVKLGYTDARGEMVNFADYGVPQRRQRFVVVATRDGLANTIFLTLEGNKKSFLDTKGIGSVVGCEMALSDLERKHGIAICPDSRRFFSGIISKCPTEYQKNFRLANQDGYIPDSHRFVNHTSQMVNVFEILLEKAPRNKTIKEEKAQYGFKKRSLMVLERNAPAPTITTIPDDFVHYSEPRVMTVRECARLQTFPDWFEFKGPYTTGNKERVRQVPRYTQVGNAVPPLFAEQLGLAIKQVLAGKS